MYNSNLSKFCPGCGYTIVLNSLHRVLEKMELSDKAVLGLDIGCSLLAINSLPINTFQTHHGRVTPIMIGFKRAQNDSICVGLTGDGGAYAIGLQSLLHSAKRDEAVSIIVMNNTVYAMTGGQISPTSLRGQKTSTSPQGYEEEPFLGPELFKNIVKDGAYLARTAVNEPQDLIACLEKAIKTQQAGHFSLIEILTFCPTNWRVVGKEMIERLDGLKNIFKIGEI